MTCKSSGKKRTCAKRLCPLKPDVNLFLLAECWVSPSVCKSLNVVTLPPSRSTLCVAALDSIGEPPHQWMTFQSLVVEERFTMKMGTSNFFWRREIVTSDNSAGLGEFVFNGEQTVFHATLHSWPLFTEWAPPPVVPFTVVVVAVTLFQNPFFNQGHIAQACDKELANAELLRVHGLFWWLRWWPIVSPCHCFEEVCP